MDMNYLQIVLQGYFDENNREFLDKYFLEEFKKAEKEHFCHADKFFNGCLIITKYWAKYLNKLVLDHKREMYFMLNEAKNNNLKYDENEGKSIEQNRKETIEYCEQELNNLNIVNYSINLSSIKNGGIPYNLQYSEVLFIENAILQAFEKTQPEIEQLQPQPIIQNAKINQPKLKKDYKNNKWFEVGLLFAKGEIQNFKKLNPEMSFDNICYHFFKNKSSYRPYVSQTYNNSTNDDKNIYHNVHKMKTIKNHCEENKIAICENFESILKLLKID